MDWLIEPFQHEFMRTALYTGVLVAITTSVVGTWVVLRGLAFMGDALAHGVIPGIAVAFLLDINPFLGAAVAAFFMVAAIAVIHRSTKLSEDTAIGLLFVGMLALGVIVISRSRSFVVDVVAILFGDVLGITVGDLQIAAVITVIVIASVALFYRPLVSLSFNEEKAAVLGMAPRWAHFVMLGLITLAIVASFPTVGALLVFGLLVAPPATAALLTRRIPGMMVAAAAFGIVSVFTGLVLSFHLDTAGGATMSFVAVTLFFVVLAVRRMITWRRQRAAVAEMG